ncbi:DUF2231 domain-containing protein [Gracilimonas halophila]|uniref:DUF2231 domain-containing protein n=1 Tax=Gracilimonas halophila TaxID=1834464 RepID=A0ABW5JJ61_9BACT
MGELPDIWRTELWHPMVVHFPIVLLLGATILRLISYLFAKNKRTFLKNTSRLSLYTGVIMAWIAIYTGTLADAIVVHDLCDPTVLEAHEHAAFTLAYIFTLATLLDLISFIPWKTLALLNHHIKEWVVVIFLVAGSIYLGYTAHLGASLVYQQGAGVYEPTVGCTEFE